MLRLGLAGVLTVLVSGTTAQSVLVLQPDPGVGIDASLGYHDNYGTSGNNYGTDMYLKAYAIPGAIGGVNANRGLLKFDLSQLPTGAIIQGATLDLYATGTINALLPGHFGDNMAWLRRVTSPWSEGTVTWDTAPMTTTQDQVQVPESVSPIQDYSLDVTAMITVMASDPVLNQGMLLALDLEDPMDQSGLLFYSSDWTQPSKRPKLSITYVIDECSAAGPEIAYDASLGYHTGYGTDQNNYGADLYLKAFALEGSMGGINANRALLKFDLGNIPSGAVIDSSILVLNAVGYVNALLPGHFGPNEAQILRVVQPWSEGMVTWANAPATTNLSMVSVGASSFSMEDYRIDVTGLTIDMVNDLPNSHGFLLRLVTEDPGTPAAVVFHSSDSPDATEWPRLCVWWHEGSFEAVTELVNDGALSTLLAYPGCWISVLPAVGQSGRCAFQAYDLNSRIVASGSIYRDGAGVGRVLVPDLGSGTYFLRLQGSDSIRTIRLIVP